MNNGTKPYQKGDKTFQVEETTASLQAGTKWRRKDNVGVPSEGEGGIGGDGPALHIALQTILDVKGKK